MLCKIVGSNCKKEGEVRINLSESKYFDQCFVLYFYEESLAPQKKLGLRAALPTAMK
jgi:hypothetical protein